MQGRQRERVRAATLCQSNTNVLPRLNLFSGEPPLADGLCLVLLEELPLKRSNQLLLLTDINITQFNTTSLHTQVQTHAQGAAVSVTRSSGPKAGP